MRLLEAEHIGNLLRHRLNLHAEPAAADGPLVFELRDHRAHRCRRDRERNADRAAGRREDHHIDPDHLAVEVEGRAARVAFVDGCIDLQKALRTDASDSALARRDDASGYGAAEPEGIADRQHPVADARHVFGEPHKGEVAAALHFQQREVADRVPAHHLGAIGLLVVGLDLRCLAALDHVIVRDGVAVRRDEETRSLGGHHARPMPAARSIRRKRRSELAQKAIHGRATLLVQAFRALRLHTDNGRLHRLDDISEARGTRAAAANEQIRWPQRSRLQRCRPVARRKAYRRSPRRCRQCNDGSENCGAQRKRAGFYIGEVVLHVSSLFSLLLADDLRRTRPKKPPRFARIAGRCTAWAFSRSR